MAGDTALTEQQVDHVANLARLEITAEEREQFRHQLGVIIEYVDTLQQLPTDDVEATLGAFPHENVFREDEPREPMGADGVLANAPDTLQGGFRIPRILGGDS